LCSIFPIFSPQQLKLIKFYPHLLIKYN
jgi:hypothetical protein